MPARDPRTPADEASAPAGTSEASATSAPEWDESPSESLDGLTAAPSRRRVTREAEHGWVLSELDQIREAFPTEDPYDAVGPAEPPAPVAIPPASPADPAEVGPRDSAPSPAVELPEASPAPASERWGERTPYLEERLRLARAAARGLEDSVQALADRSATLRTTIATLERELDRASDEAKFLREHEERNDAVEPPVAPPRSAGGPPATTVAPPPAAPVADRARYRAFTLDRYNATMAEVQRRRKRTATFALLAAALISAALLALAVLANEPMPSLWLGVLPLVWMVPVPFFVLAFRGTHRILRRQPFELAEAR